MRNIKLTYQYDGSDFFGSQRQPNQRTVQGEIEKILRMVFKRDITMVTAGRTDRGVHALMQVSNFVVDDGGIPCKKLKYVLQNALPRDIKIQKVEEVKEDFHARFSAKDRAYVYKIKSEKNLFERNQYLWVDEKINIKKLENILKPLIGEHDFESFRKSDCAAQNSFREIKEIKCYEEKETVVIYLKANAFLKSMVRIIVGSALAVYLGKKPESYIMDKLKNPSSTDAKILAEPQGLYLCEIDYGELDS